MQRLKEVSNCKAKTHVGLWALLLGVCLIWALAPSAVWALGTAAGTTISNTATANYSIGGTAAAPVDSAPITFNVEEIIDVTVAWQNAAPLPVTSPDTNRPLTFLVTNTGNGPESVRLLFDDTLGGDDFNPAVQSIWLETNSTAGLQTGGATPDTLYTSGINDPNLANDGSIIAYAVSNIPGGQIDGNTGDVQLTAEALTPGAAGAAAGTLLSGLGAGGGDAIVGTTNADGAATGSYVVVSLAVSLVKSIQQIADTFGGNQPFPGATVTYRIVVTVAGSGTAQGLVITDTIPVNTTYVPGSIRLDTVAQTDADDSPTDNSDFNITNANTVTVNLGDVAAPATYTVDFSATIN